MKESSESIRILPVTPSRWPDLETLFGERGACGGCWCMFWRVPRKEFEKNKGLGNKRALQDLVSRGLKPGVIAYHGQEPIGWCAVAPRELYLGLANSRILKPVDDQAVWSVSCLFVNKEYRRRGLSTTLLRGAVEFAQKRGAKILEGYPTEPGKANTPDAFLWHGVPSAFIKAGFKEVTRRSESRPIMRFVIKG